MSRPKQSIEHKVQKEFPEFVSEVQGLAIEALKNRLTVLAMASVDNDKAQEDDEELEQAKEACSELAAPYRDAKKALKLKQRFLMSLIKEKDSA